MKRLIVISLLAVLMTACASAPPPVPPQAVVSTPLADLPVNVAFQMPTAVPQTVIDAADAEYELLINIYDRVTPSVVNIEVIALQAESDMLDLGRGSGFIFDTDGHIITNAHVVSDARTIEVTFNNGYIAEAQVVGVDAYSDIAVLKVDVAAERLVPVTLGDSSVLRVGERAIAIGNPFGLTSSMTVGIISGLGRQLPSSDLISTEGLASFNNPSIIQVDTDINPGNSGGPLINSHGEVVGINTAIRTESGVFQGVGFAVPANTIQRVVPEIIANGAVDYPWIGISTLPEESGFSVAALAEPLNLPVDGGVLINSVNSDSPADKAGLQGGSQSRMVRGAPICAGGDIIVAVDGVYVDGIDELLAYIVMHSRPGDILNLLVVRNTETFELPLTLESRPTGDVGEAINGCR
ncbi:MAG: trypsin-like peptidase domain-containing protein [Anaerolineae bacterium]|nr:trypsin-like peptidase domain-containing protein [Anaerolineae bacterium]